MYKKRMAVILSLLLIFIQGAYSYGFSTKVNAAEISDNIITSVTMAVYDNGVPVTDVVYKQGAEVKLTYNWELPDSTYKGGDTYSFELPDKFVLASDINGTPLIFDGVPLGHFDVLKGSPNKVVMTFNDDIQSYFGVHGSFTISTKFDKSKFTETTVQQIVFPIDGGNQTVTLTFVPEVTSTIAKSGVPTGSNKDNLNAKQIIWTVDVNKVLSNVYGATLTDIIPAGLALVNPLDVKVYNLNVKLDGSVTQGAELDDSRYAVTTPAGKLNVAFNDSPITGAYRIQFTTDITDGDKTSFTNSAAFQRFQSGGSYSICNSERTAGQLFKEDVHQL
ncbi:collagen binding domain-containing protein [Paenibacillus ihuae]|uniref:collagen binding domain-containing protein n=1 Tax=Paenibacillus ihuae TaxID=1232431 RepID=UPI0006D59C94|nr:collagen binding domain-containing protein [Paenibacillus ihuae]